jgi:DNA-binding response OmpR family regulator
VKSVDDAMRNEQATGVACGTSDARRSLVADRSSYASKYTGRVMRVLLAEDDHEMRRLLASTLRREHCDVIEAGNGLQLAELIALERSAENTGPGLDLIISDVRMPGRSGLEVLTVLRRNDKETPVILITAFGEPDTHAEAYRLGALAVFNKPFDIDDLRMMVASLREGD